PDPHAPRRPRPDRYDQPAGSPRALAPLTRRRPPSAFLSAAPSRTRATPRPPPPEGRHHQAPISERETGPHHHEARQRNEPRDRLTDDAERRAGVQRSRPASRLPAGGLAVEGLPRRDLPVVRSRTSVWRFCGWPPLLWSMVNRTSRSGEIGWFIVMRRMS